MNEEQIKNKKKIARDTFNESIMNNLDSSIIFKYIEGLEKENQKYKEILERINNYLDKKYTMENQYWFDHIRDIINDR